MLVDEAFTEGNHQIPLRQKGLALLTSSPICNDPPHTHTKSGLGRRHKCTQ